MQLSDKALSLVLEKYKDLNQSRLEHTLGVAKMAKLLALRYNVDIEKALIASYMHDYSKYDDINLAKDILSNDDIKECEKYPFLYHAYLSAEAYKRLLGSDNDIYLAIRNHVFGRPNMTDLEKIIMIADYTEENRKYESCIECRNILLDGNIDLAIYYSTLKTIEVAMENGGTPHPKQLEVLEEYKRKVYL